MLSSVAGHDAGPEGSSSIGRAPVSKTGGWGFESLLPCRPLFRAEDCCVNRPTKRLLQRQGQIDEEGAPTGGGRRPPPTRRPPGGTGPGSGGRGDRPSLPSRIVEFSREVRNELAKVAWPNRQEVVKYTIVVFVTLVFMTSLVFGLDAGFAKGVLFLFGR